MFFPPFFDLVVSFFLQAKNAYDNNIPIVLSAIHHPIDKVKLYEDKYRYDFRRILNILIVNQNLRDSIKNLYRSLKYPKKLYPTLVQIFMGIHKQQKAILNYSSAVLVQTNKEQEELIDLFGNKDKYYKRVVIGADTPKFLASNPSIFNCHIEKYLPDLIGKKFILNVGRIEPRKNQLSLIKAYKEAKKRGLLNDYSLLFIGASNMYHPEYNFRFERDIKYSSDIYHILEVPQDFVASAMSACSLCVSTSWFETIGLTNVEAYLAGAPILTTVKRLGEYIKSSIEYCEPDDVDSIVEGLIKAVKLSPPTKEEKKLIAETMDWSQTAIQTIEVYNMLLNKKSTA